MIKSLYVHVPFCSHICDYCDFAKCRYSAVLAQKYLSALEKELSCIQQDSFFTCYIGGGTPTALNHQQLEQLLKIITRFQIEDEFTIEINPETFDLKKAEILKKYGVNRVSIGLQSFQQHILNSMHRLHTPQDVSVTFEALDQVGITNRSIDLMYGFENQSVEDVMNDLEKAVRLPITHISIYDLEVHENTPLGKRKYVHCDPQQDYLIYKAILDYLPSAGFHQYEISNFAKEGYASKHNQTYWHYEDFYGAGVGGCGKIGNQRLSNTINIAQYIKGEDFTEIQQLSDEDVLFERVMMGLRMNEGIVMDSSLQIYQNAIEKNIKKGLLEISENRLCTTEKGRFVLNDILVDFI